MIYSHKYGIADYLEEWLIGEEKISEFGFLPKSIRDGQTFRLPHFDALPTIKDYMNFYEFMKSPYNQYLIEMPLDDSGWLIYSVTDFREECHDIVCLIFIRHDRYELIGDISISMDEDGYEVSTKNGIGDADDDILRRFAWTVFEFMVAVNTPNIKQKEISAPKSINEKRKKKGKSLLAGYKFLDLGEKQQYQNNTIGGGPKKRLHWRRGHIRRLKDKTIWINQTLVGNGEFTDKTYRVKFNLTKEN